MKILKKSILIWVLMPVLISLIYFYYFATPRYIVESRFSVQNTKTPTSTNVLTSLGLGSGNVNHDSYIIKSYINSNSIIKDIEKKNKMNVRSFFSAANIDLLSRLSSNSSEQDLLDYWKKRVKTDYDSITGIITLRTNAFTAKDSLILNQSIIHSSENLVNSLSERDRNDLLILAQTELKRAEANLAKIKEKILNFRSNNQNIDPSKTAEGKVTIITTLEAELSKAQAELISLKSYAKPTAPVVKALEAKIQGLRHQIAREEVNISISSRNKRSNVPELINEYESLLIDKDFAEKLYASSLVSLEASKLDAAKQQRYLTVFVNPSLPDRAEEPNIFMSVLTVFIVAFLIWGIGSITINAIKDHAV